MMRLKVLLAAASISTGLCSPITYADGDLLTGDIRLACEALLCLSSDTRPSECTPSLERYFAIHYRNLSDTLDARLDFLNLCPSSKSLPQLTRTIARGAGRCDAASLNKIGRRTKNGDFIISSTKPSYCIDYEQLTRQTLTKSEPIYCTRWESVTFGKAKIEQYKCGHKWVDVK